MKKILSFILIISMLSSLFSTFPMVASAATNTGDVPISIEAVYCYYKEGKVRASVRFEDHTDESGTVFLAVYDEGKLVNIGQNTFEEGKSAKVVEITGVDERYIGYEVRAFCWGRENSMIPISLPFIEEITDYQTVMVRILNAVSDELDIYTVRTNKTFSNQEKAILKPINACIDDAVANHASELDDNFAEFIETYYGEEINGENGVKKIYEDMTDEEEGTFKSRLVNNFTLANLIWLAEALGIDVEQFGINKEDYV